MPEEISNIKESIFMKYTDKMKDLYIKKNSLFNLLLLHFH